MVEAHPGEIVVEHVVTDADTARALGSGDVDVLGTPRLLAWCEAASLLAIGELPPGTTSVGTHVVVEHLRPSPVGSRVAVSARLVAREVRTLEIEAVAETVPETGAAGEPVVLGRVRVTRAIVARDRFPGA